MKTKIGILPRGVVCLRLHEEQGLCSLEQHQGFMDLAACREILSY
jgi:hypothetical protein